MTPERTHQGLLPVLPRQGPARVLLPSILCANRRRPSSAQKPGKALLLGQRWERWELHLRAHALPRAAGGGAALQGSVSGEGAGFSRGEGGVLAGREQLCGSRLQTAMGVASLRTARQRHLGLRCRGPLLRTGRRAEVCVTPFCARNSRPGARSRLST